MMILFFVFTIGLTVGGLLSAAKQPPQLLHVIFFTLVFGLLTYLGMIVGMFLFPFFAIWFIEILIVIVTLLFIVATATSFHPTFGFFKQDRGIGLIMLAALFFLMGFEWGIIEMRTFFTLLATALFLLALFIGLFVQQQIQMAMWRISYIVYTPLIWLLFVSIIKLL